MDGQLRLSVLSVVMPSCDGGDFGFGLHYGFFDLLWLSHVSYVSEVNINLLQSVFVMLFLALMYNYLALYIPTDTRKEFYALADRIFGM